MNTIIKKTTDGIKNSAIGKEVKESPFGFSHFFKKTPKYLGTTGIVFMTVSGIVTLFTPVKWAIAMGMAGSALIQLFGKK